MIDSFKAVKIPVCAAHAGRGIYCDECGHALWLHSHMREVREPGRWFHRVLHPLEKSAARKHPDAASSES